MADDVEELLKDFVRDTEGFKRAKEGELDSAERRALEMAQKPARWLWVTTLPRLVGAGVLVFALSLVSRTAATILWWASCILFVLPLVKAVGAARRPVSLARREGMRLVVLLPVLIRSGLPSLMSAMGFQTALWFIVGWLLKIGPFGH
jgi:hypothetical protein